MITQIMRPGISAFNTVKRIAGCSRQKVNRQMELVGLIQTEKSQHYKKSTEPSFLVAIFPKGVDSISATVTISG